MNKKENLFWVDAVKAFCMIFVFFAHAELYTGFTIKPVDYFFRTFYVNGFFFVTGYLLFRKQLGTVLISQSRKEWLSSQVGGGDVNK